QPGGEKGLGGFGFRRSLLPVVRLPAVLRGVVLAVLILGNRRLLFGLLRPVGYGGRTGETGCCLLLVVLLRLLLGRRHGTASLAGKAHHIVARPLPPAG